MQLANRPQAVFHQTHSGKQNHPAIIYKTMKIQIDLKSALCGLFAGVAVMLCVGAGTSSNPVGKYQIVGAAAPNGAFFAVVDTQTGQAWGMDSQRNFQDNGNGVFWGAKQN
jgi:hypothetical protein